MTQRVTRPMLNSGGDTRTSAYWNLDAPMFQNPARKHMHVPRAMSRMGMAWSMASVCWDRLVTADFASATRTPPGLAPTSHRASTDP